MPLLKSLDDENYSDEFIKNGAILINDSHAVFILANDHPACSRLSSIYIKFSIECQEEFRACSKAKKLKECHIIAYNFEYFFIKEIYDKNGKLTDQCEKVPYMMSAARIVTGKHLS